VRLTSLGPKPTRVSSMPAYVLLTERANHAGSGTRLAFVSNHSLAESGNSPAGEHHAAGLSAPRANKERQTAKARRTAVVMLAVIKARLSMSRTSPALQLMVYQRRLERLPSRFRVLSQHISSLDDITSTIIDLSTFHQHSAEFVGMDFPQDIIPHIISLLRNTLPGAEKAWQLFDLSMQRTSHGFDYKSIPVIGKCTSYLNSIMVDYGVHRKDLIYPNIIIHLLGAFC
jgi:hypothetical protein